MCILERVVILLRDADETHIKSNLRRHNGRDFILLTHLSVKIMSECRHARAWKCRIIPCRRFYFLLFTRV